MTELEERLRSRGVGRAIIDRVLRLNPNPREGQRLRGIHFKQTYRVRRFFMDFVSKGEFIRQYGRPVWDRIPMAYIEKDGKRSYVSRRAVEDNVWMLNEHG